MGGACTAAQWQPPTVSPKALGASGCSDHGPARGRGEGPALQGAPHVCKMRRMTNFEYDFLEQSVIAGGGGPSLWPHSLISELPCVGPGGRLQVSALGAYTASPGPKPSHPPLLLGKGCQGQKPRWGRFGEWTSPFGSQLLPLAGRPALISLNWIPWGDEERQ